MKPILSIPCCLALLSLGAAAQTDGGAIETLAAQAPVAVESVKLATWEMIVFCIVVVGVIALGIWKANDPTESDEDKKANGAADYFLAGRGLSWWLVGFSLIAANISTEQFVGMSGKAANWVGLAIAGYEWLAAITLVIVAFSFLPMLLKRGVFTIPQFLEERYDGKARSIMAISNLIILVGVPTAGVIYAGAKVVSGYFDLSMPTSCCIIAASATVYVFVGGLKACAWTDLIWGAALIFGGGVVAWFALDALALADPHELIKTASATSNVTVESLKDAGAIDRFMSLNGGEAITGTNAAGGKLSMVRPSDDAEIPWTALCLGLWIPNFFYWGLNQYIMQRTLASKSLAEGQKGIVFAAALKLLIPFVVLVPGILAYNLYNVDMQSTANLKSIAAISKVEATGKTPLYKVTTDYFVTNTADATNATVLSGAELISRNIKAAGNPEQQAKANSLFADFSLLLVTTDTKAPAMGELISKHGIYVPESITDFDKTRRIVASDLATKIVAINDVILTAKATDTSVAISAPLNGYDYDSAFSVLLRKLLPNTGWAWFVLAALFGAVVSSLASMLNSASTLFTMDIYNKMRNEQASQSELVKVGKLGVLVCSAIALGLSIYLAEGMDSIFSYIQEFQGFLSPGALVVFLFGFFVHKCPRFFGWLGIAINVVLYGAIKILIPAMPFLNRMAICFIVIILVGAIVTAVHSARGGKAIILEDKGIVEMESSKGAKYAGIAVVIATIVLYIIFWG